MQIYSYFDKWKNCMHTIVFKWISYINFSIYFLCLCTVVGGQFLGQIQIAGEVEEDCSTLTCAAVNQITNPHNSVQASENFPRLLLLLQDIIVWNADFKYLTPLHVFLHMLPNTNTQRYILLHAYAHTYTYLGVCRHTRVCVCIPLAFPSWHLYSVLYLFWSWTSLSRAWFWSLALSDHRRLLFLFHACSLSVWLSVCTWGLQCQSAAGFLAVCVNWSRWVLPTQLHTH